VYYICSVGDVTEDLFGRLWRKQGQDRGTDCIVLSGVATSRSSVVLELCYH